MKTELLSAPLPALLSGSLDDRNSTVEPISLPQVLWPGLGQSASERERSAGLAMPHSDLWNSRGGGAPGVAAAVRNMAPEGSSSTRSRSQRLEISGEHTQDDLRNGLIPLGDLLLSSTVEIE